MARKTDSELAAIISGRCDNGTFGGEGKLARERELVQKFRDGELPARLHKGDSDYVSYDVYDGHETMKAQLLEVFAGNVMPVKFEPVGPDDVEFAQEGTEAVQWELFRRNKGFAVMRDTIDDALSSRAGVVQVWYDRRKEYFERKMTDVSEEEVTQILANSPPDDIKDVEQDPETGLYSAVLVYTKDASQVRVENVPPEEFGISKGARSLEDAVERGVVFRQRRLTAQELLDMGVEKSKVDELKENEEEWSSKETDAMNRAAETDDGPSDSFDRDGADRTRRIEVRECFSRMDLDGVVKLWRFLLAGKTMLIKEPVRRIPFFAYVPLTKPHTFWGDNFCRKLFQTQVARTLLVRSVINHALITTNPRTGVVKGGLLNPKELTESRLGGIVNLRSADALVPIQMTGLNPFVFQTMQSLDEDKEETTGISKLSQGLNKDAISQQNSADMVQNLIGVSQTRQKVAARNFAEDFLKPLAIEIYTLIIENEPAEKIMQVAGVYKTVDPSAWPVRDDVTCELSVGFGERDREAQKWTQIDQYLTAQGLGPYYSPDQRFYVLSRVLNAMGVKNVEAVIGNPQKVEPPQPDPLAMAEVKVKEAQAAQAQANAQAAVQKIQTEMQRDALKHQAEMRKLQMEMQEMTDKSTLDRMTLMHDIQIDNREMDLAERQAAAATEVKANTIISPS